MKAPKLAYIRAGASGELFDALTAHGDEAKLQRARRALGDRA